MNLPTLYGQNIYLFRCESFMADGMGLGSTTLHYLAVRQAMVSVLPENGFQGAIKPQGSPFSKRVLSLT